MKQFMGLLVILFLTVFNKSIAQTNTALPFFYYSPSLQSNGLGLTGTSIPSNDAFGFYYNPANLGYFGRDRNLSLQFYSSADLISEFPASINAQYNSYALNFGYNFKQYCGVNLSAGAGFISHKLRYKSFFNMPANDEDSYNAFGIGILLDHYISLSLGITYKSIASQIAGANADAGSVDYGFLIEIPVTKLIDDNLSFPISGSVNLLPLFNYSIGYARLFSGDEIYYIDPAQSDPLPITARLGHSLNFAFDLQTSKLELNLITYNLILETDDILVKHEFINNKTEKIYQGMLGDIKIGRNLFQLKGDNNVNVHKGHYISFLETFTLLKGSYSGRIQGTAKTDGFIISTRGLSKWLNNIISSNVMNYVANHIEINFISSSVLAGTLVETDFSGISVSFSNFSFN